KAGIWNQTWVSNRGQHLVISGRLEKGEMWLGTARSEKGTTDSVKGVWKPVGGAVRETAWKSTDGGKTWVPWFDLMFLPHKDNKTENENPDAAEVAELDRVYQGAVEKNDAEAMDKILSDDFVITTGRGKRYSKADLLEEARSKKYVYERQD